MATVDSPAANAVLEVSTKATFKVRPALSGRVTVVALIAILSVLIILPVAVLVAGSFLSEPPRALQFDWSGLTLRNYLAVLSDDGLFVLLRNSFVVATLGTLGALVIGAGLAWIGVRTDVPGRGILSSVSILPMFVPPLVGAFAWDILASPRSGLINLGLRELSLPIHVDIYSIWGIGFVFAIYYAPYVYLFVSAALRNMDPSLEEAAAMSGANRWTTLWRVTLPLISPALLSAALLVFVLLIELFAIPAVLGEPGNLHVFSVRIWELIGFTPPQVNQASAMGVLMLLLTMALVWLQHRILSKRSYVTVAGKGVRPRVIPMGVFRWPVALAAFGYIVMVVLLPYAALVLIALRKTLFFSRLSAVFNPNQLTLDHFWSAYNDSVVRTSFQNSLAVSFLTVAIGTVLYFAAAYVIHRTRLPGRRAIDLITVIPIAIPGLVIGLGYLWSWISIPVGIYGTLWIIILAYVGQFSPQGVRAIATSLIQIHPELEESARLSGAGFFYMLRRVVIPLAWPGILSGMILLMVLSFRELATALFLYTTNTQVFSLTMFDFWARGSTSMVAVMALCQSLVLLVLVVLGNVIRRGHE